MTRLQVETLGLALADLGAHAADMQSSEQDHHDACLYCETAVLLSRVTRWGAQLRQVELEELRK